VEALVAWPFLFVGTPCTRRHVVAPRAPHLLVFVGSRCAKRGVLSLLAGETSARGAGVGVRLARPSARLRLRSARPGAHPTSPKSSVL
jgi:hypothetical protein